jgi:hypothetical protein
MLQSLSINSLKSKAVPNNFCHIVCVWVLHACKSGAAALSKQEIIYFTF